MNIIQKAKKYAMNAHKGQKDDSGNDYFKSHTLKVASAVAQLVSDKEVIASAFLHDVLEDTEISFAELKNEFGSRVASLVYELTHEGNAKTGYFFPRLKSQEAIMIKLVDRASNVSRMESWSELRKRDYINKTRFWRQ